MDRSHASPHDHKVKGCERVLRPATLRMEICDSGFPWAHRDASGRSTAIPFGTSCALSARASQGTCGLVAITSASDAEGRQFDPGQVYCLGPVLVDRAAHAAARLQYVEAGFAHRACVVLFLVSGSRGALA